jgi:hypothetical protein
MQAVWDHTRSLRHHCCLAYSFLGLSRPTFIRAQRRLQHYCHLYHAASWVAVWDHTRSFLRLSRPTCPNIIVIHSPSQALASHSHVCIESYDAAWLPSFALSGACNFIVVLRHHSRPLRHSCRLLIHASVPSTRLSSHNDGRTSSLHYYYLAFLIYLAYLIAVNTSHISSLGTTDPGIQALVALDWLFGESEKHSLSPSIHQ